MAGVEARGSTLTKVVIRYSLSLVAVVAAFLLRQVLVQFIGAELPAFLFFYPAVMVVSLLGGLGPGLLATAFAALLADYWIFKPIGQFAIANTSDAIALAFFFGMGIFMSVVAERYRVYSRRVGAIKGQQALQETEAKLKKQSETQFETLANAIPQLCWMANADGWIFWYNERWYSYTGTTPQQMEGWGWQSVHDPDSLPKVLEQWQASIATGEPFDMVFPLRGGDGKFRPFLTRVMPVKDTDGKVVQWFGTNTDISDQKEVEADLRKNKARLDLTLEVADVGEWELDLKRNTGFRSSRHAQIFGCSSYQPEWSYERFLEHVIPEHRTEVDEKVRAALGGAAWDFETQIRRVDGAVRWLWVRGRSWLDEAGEPTRAFGTTMDITDRKLAEESVREREALLQEVGRMAKVGGWEFDPATGEGSWTEQVARIHDLDPNEPVSAEMGKAFYHGASRALIESAVQEAVEQAKPYDLELEIVSAKGVHKWVRTTGHPIVENGKVVKMRGSFQDISDRKQAESVLQATLQRFYVILSNMSSGVLLVTDEGQVEFANHAFCERFNLNDAPADLTGIEPGDMIEKIRNVHRNPAAAAARIRELLSNGKSVLGEELPMRDGRTFLRDFVPLKLDGKSYGRLWIHSDISERKQAEELRARLASIVEFSGDAIISKDLDGVISTWNRSAESLFGYSAEEAIGQPITLIIPPERQHEEIEFLAKLRKGHCVEHFETIRMCKNGRRFDVSVTLSPIYDASGAVTGISKNVRDITERKRAEAALQESEERWATTLRSIGDAVISTDAAGKIVFMNDVAQKLTGWTLAEAVGNDLDVVFDIVQEVTRIKPESPAAKVIRLGQVVGLANHTALIRRDGTEIPIEDSGAPVRDREGRIDGVVLVFHDVSEQRSIEKVLRTNERLATTGRLAATIAHEIHNPLDSIGGLLHLIKQDSQEEGVRTFATMAGQEVVRITQMTQQMLAFQREAAKPIPVKIGDVLETVVGLYERKIKSAGIHLERQIEPDIQIVALPGELRQMFANLLGNAVEAASPRHGTITIRTHESRNRRNGKPGLRVVVADEGVGIPASVRAKIFEPFFTTKGESGTGLGLWITTDILRKYQGTMQLRSSTKNGSSGTCFSIFLPFEVDPEE